MTGGEWTGLLGALASIITPIGLGFGWLIRTIVANSKEAVKELQVALKDAEDERDLWRDRAYNAGWRADT